MISVSEALFDPVSLKQGKGSSCESSSQALVKVACRSVFSNELATNRVIVWRDARPRNEGYALARSQKVMGLNPCAGKGFFS